MSNYAEWLKCRFKGLIRRGKYFRNPFSQEKRRSGAARGPRRRINAGKSLHNDSKPQLPPGKVRPPQRFRATKRVFICVSSCFNLISAAFMDNQRNGRAAITVICAFNNLFIIARVSRSFHFLFIGSSGFNLPVKDAFFVPEIESRPSQETPTFTLQTNMNRF